MPRPAHANVPASVVLAVDLLLLAVLGVVHFVNAATIESRLFDVDLENNVPTWFSSANFVLAAFLCALAAGRERGRSRLGWAAVSICALAFSLDETASVHEVAGRRIGEEATLSLTQPIAAAIVACLFLVCAQYVTAGAWVLRGAAGVLTFSQACASVAGLLLSSRARTAVEAVEDLTETLTAVSLLAAGLIALGAAIDLRPRALLREWQQWVSDERNRGYIATERTASRK